MIHRPLARAFSRPARACHRNISSTTRRRAPGSEKAKRSYQSRLGTAFNKTKVRWRPIPIAVGIGFLGLFQLYRVQIREEYRREQEWRGQHPDDDDGRVRPRERVRPSGPWSVQIMSTLPLKMLSRLWGKFNSIEIPYYFRVPGYHLYGWIFGVNFAEIEEQDLHNFKNLSEFFYRTLKPGVRPLDPRPNALLSPADGRIVQFGVIENGEVEQVKGVTYSVDALLGTEPVSGALTNSNISSSQQSAQPSDARDRKGDAEIIQTDEEFARVNGISYTLPHLFSGDKPRQGSLLWKSQKDDASDQSMRSQPSSEGEVASSLASSQRPWYYPAQKETPTALYYCVVYLAPGDYHRFHSPVSWVVESRRHFAGELYSVSPFLVKNLPGLFTLNERIVLLGRWKYGFFSYTPVGATNVGSIIVNFDKELRTNSLLTDTLADRAAAKAQENGEPYSGFSEAHYSNASPILNGHALAKGEEMGGFQLGSTIVMVFEAPKGRRPTFDEGFTGEGRVGGWTWTISKGETVKVGQALGHVSDDSKVIVE